MKNQLLSLSRNVFKAVNMFDNMLTQVIVMIGELRDIKELLRLQNEQGCDTRLLTPEEVADKLQVTIRTLSNWDRTGKLIPIRFGSKSYYRISDVIQFGMLGRELSSVTPG